MCNIPTTICFFVHILISSVKASEHCSSGSMVKSKILIFYDMLCSEHDIEEIEKSIDEGLLEFHFNIEVKKAENRKYTDPGLENVRCPRINDFPAYYDAFKRSLKGNYSEYLSVIVLTDLPSVEEIKINKKSASFCSEDNIIFIKTEDLVKNHRLLHVQ